jgi:hypothetical protein
MHLPLSWWARFVSANIPFFKRSAFFTKMFLLHWNYQKHISIHFWIIY